MSTSEKLDRALTILRANGHEIGDGNGHGAFISPTGDMLVTVDGKLLTYAQIYELAELPE
jgi:hypothetical protein